MGWMQVEDALLPLEVSLDQLPARAGQFFLWRFLGYNRWWQVNPWSLSAAPDGRSLRITAKGIGTTSAGLRELPVGTRVFAEGPYGAFTSMQRTKNATLLIAGGIGITPIRALFESMRADLIVLYRVVEEEDVIFRRELDALSAASGAVVHYLVGDHEGNGRDLLAPAHLLELVPDIVERDVFLCGPPAMAAYIRKNVREAKVPRRQVHAERFALT